MVVTLRTALFLLGHHSCRTLVANAAHAGWRAAVSTDWRLFHAERASPSPCSALSATINSSPVGSTVQHPEKGLIAASMSDFLLRVITTQVV